MIENEYVSDFPVYSHRMRNTLTKGVEIFDAFIVECDKNLHTMETNVELFLNEKYNEHMQKIQELRGNYNTDVNNWKSEFKEFKNDCRKKFNRGKADYDTYVKNKNSEYDSYIASKKSDYDTYTTNKKQDYETFVSNKKQDYENYINQTVNPKITEMADRINRFDELKKGTYASYSDVYLLTVDA